MPLTAPCQHHISQLSSSHLPRPAGVTTAMLSNANKKAKGRSDWPKKQLQEEGEQHLGPISPVEEAIYYYNGFIQSESAYIGGFLFK